MDISGILGQENVTKYAKWAPGAVVADGAMAGAGARRGAMAAMRAGKGRGQAHAPSQTGEYSPGGAGAISATGPRPPRPSAVHATSMTA